MVLFQQRWKLVKRELYIDPFAQYEHEPDLDHAGTVRDVSPVAERWGNSLNLGEIRTTMENIATDTELPWVDIPDELLLNFVPEHTRTSSPKKITLALPPGALPKLAAGYSQGSSRHLHGTNFPSLLAVGDQPLLTANASALIEHAQSDADTGEYSPNYRKYRFDDHSNLVDQSAFFSSLNQGLRTYRTFVELPGSISLLARGQLSAYRIHREVRHQQNLRAIAKQRTSEFFLRQPDFRELRREVLSALAQFVRMLDQAIRFNQSAYRTLVTDFHRTIRSYRPQIASDLCRWLDQEVHARTTKKKSDAERARQLAEEKAEAENQELAAKQRRHEEEAPLREQARKDSEVAELDQTHVDLDHELQVQKLQIQAAKKQNKLRRDSEKLDAVVNEEAEKEKQRRDEFDREQKHLLWAMIERQNLWLKINAQVDHEAAVREMPASPEDVRVEKKNRFTAELSKRSEINLPEPDEAWLQEHLKQNS